MSSDNQYIKKEEAIPDNSQDNKAKKKAPKVEKKEFNTTKEKMQNPLGAISSRLDQKKTKTIAGIILVLFSLYFFFACFSYIFTWSSDQDRVIGKSLIDFLFEENQEPVSNWFGKVGAWFSHLFMYRWFGIASFSFSFLMFITGFYWMLNIKILPLTRSFSIALIFTIWASIFFGFFASQVNYLGGAFGFYVNQWLSLTLGKFGTFLFILVLLYCVVVGLFNPDFKALYKKYFSKASIEERANATDENLLRKKEMDIVAVNTIKDSEIKKENIRPAVVFDEEPIEEVNPFEDEQFAEEIEDEDDFTGELSIDKSFAQHPVADDSDDFEIEVPVEAPAYVPPINTASQELVLEKAAQDEILSESEADKLRQEFGDYDPTLELSSYVLPSLDLLVDYGNNQININKQELEDNKNKIVATLLNYKIEISKIKATVGPTVTLYEIIPAPGVRISKIKSLEDDIALSLSALGIRIIAPIPGKGTIGIEVPNSKPEMVSMRSLIASEKFQNSDYELPVVIGKTITNETFTFDLTKMPHLLVAGATGQGKSVGLNAILVSILYKKHPAQVKFVLVDPKKVELTLYNRIERHFLAKLPGEEEAIITDTSKVVNTLNSLCIEMDTRYELLKDAQVRTIKEYNAKFIARRLNPEKGHRYLPYIVVLIDEFADLIMTAGKEVEHPIARIAQLARAIGIHLIVATQRPSVNVITGMIKANFPARIAFRVQSKIDSRTILDTSGADQLIGRGDMLISTGSDLIRLQCGFVDTPEVDKICEFIGGQRAYPDALLLPEYTGEDGGDDKNIDLSDIDPLFGDGARLVVMHQQGSASLLQRKLKLGYNRAGRIIDQLEGFGIIGPFQGSKAREVLYNDMVALEEFLSSKGIN